MKKSRDIVSSNDPIHRGANRKLTDEGLLEYNSIIKRGFCYFGPEEPFRPQAKKKKGSLHGFAKRGGLIKEK